MRQVSGTSENEQVERRWLEVLLHLRGPDDLFAQQITDWEQMRALGGGDAQKDALLERLRGAFNQQMEGTIDSTGPHAWGSGGSTAEPRGAGDGTGGGARATVSWLEGRPIPMCWTTAAKSPSSEDQLSTGWNRSTMMAAHW